MVNSKQGKLLCMIFTTVLTSLRYSPLDEAGRKNILGIKGQFPNPKYWAIGNNVDAANHNAAQSVFVVKE
jgi:hypothetical protein